MCEKTILFVDDEKSILQAIKRLLRQEEYKLLTAASGKEGLALFEEHDIQLVFSDQRMPEMEGTEFLQKVRERYPETVRVVLSGYAEASVIVEAINQGGVYRFIAKPWNDEELKIAIRQCFEYYEILTQNARLTEQTRLQNEELQRLNERLEEGIQDRTRSLQLSQEILEELPLGIIGVSQEQEVVFINEYARTTFPALQQILPGAELAEVFPESLSKLVIAGLQGTETRNAVDLIWDHIQSSVRIKPLVENNIRRGCVLVVEALSPPGI